MDNGQYIVVEGPIGVGKKALAGKLAEALDGRLVLEDPYENPFLELFHQDPHQYAFQAQLHFLFSRYRKIRDLAQLSLFNRHTVTDHLFDRDRIFALVSLNEAEFTLYDQVYSLMADRVPRPDLVVYLAARTDVLMRRIEAETPNGPTPDPEYVQRINEAFKRFFFNYQQAPLLVVNVSDTDLLGRTDEFQHLLKEVRTHQRGTKHYVPLQTTT
jgi:deoxyadenosine/deoxycytidine kinase